MHISVALCTYNGQKYIQDQLYSIISQSVPVQEIFIIDDGSSDQTGDVIRDFISNLPPSVSTKIVFKTNQKSLGIAGNFQSCISETTNEWVMLSDQDDLWHSDKVKNLIQAVEQNPITKLFCTNAELVDETGQTLGYTLFQALKISKWEKRKLKSPNAFYALLRRNLATGATMFLNKDAYLKALPFPKNWLHDEWLAIIAAFSGSFKLLEINTIDYRQHSSNSIGAKKLSLRRRISKYREPRNERNSHLVRRASELKQFLDIELSNDPQNIQKLNFAQLATRYFVFHEKRLQFPKARINRFLPIGYLYLKGDYFRFGRGAKDALKDLMQPDIQHTAN